MAQLLLGLILFLGVHSVRIAAEPWRAATLARLGEARWKGLYSVVSLLGFGLLLWGFGQARLQPVLLWAPPVWSHHLAALLMLPSFILLVAAYVPGNALKARLAHPMLLGTKVWALAHLLANGQLHQLLLFGGFLVWSVLCFRAARQRDAGAGRVAPAASTSRTVLTVAIGTGVWAIFAFVLHRLLIGVAPLG